MVFCSTPFYSHNPYFNNLAGDIKSESSKFGSIYSTRESFLNSNQKFKSILELVPTTVILDKRWFIKVLTRANDRFYEGVVESFKRGKMQ